MSSRSRTRGPPLSPCNSQCAISTAGALDVKKRYAEEPHLASVLLALLVSRAHHVVRDHLGVVVGLLALVVGHNGYGHLVQDAGRFAVLGESAPAGRGRVDALVELV